MFLKKSNFPKQINFLIRIFNYLIIHLQNNKTAKHIMKSLLSLLLTLSLPTFSQNGISWSPQSEVATNNYGNLHPRIVMDGSGNPLVLWGNMSDESAYLSRWNGINFTTPVKINPQWLTIATADWMGPDMASKGDTVYIVMKQTPESSSNSQIYLVRSFDGGVTFSDPFQGSFIGDSISRFPTVTVDKPGHPIVAFMKFNPSFLDSRWVITKSNDYGTTFMTDVKASNQQGGVVCDCCPGGITNSGDTIAMLYRTNINDLRDSWTGISTDNATTFPAGFALENNNWNIASCPSSGPDGFIKGDTLYSVFMNGAGGKSKNYYSKSSLSNSTLNFVSPLTGFIPNLSTQNYPRINHFGNAAAIVWRQVVNNVVQLPILFTNDLSNGFPAQYDTVDLDEIRNADVALSNGNIFVVWEDDNSGTVKFRKGTFTPINTSINKIKDKNNFLTQNLLRDGTTLFLPDRNKNKIAIINALGQMLIQEENKSRIDISALPSGIYFVKISSRNYFTVNKIFLFHH